MADEMTEEEKKKKEVAEGKKPERDTRDKHDTSDSDSDTEIKTGPTRKKEILLGGMSNEVGGPAKEDEIVPEKENKKEEEIPNLFPYPRPVKDGETFPHVLVKTEIMIPVSDAHPRYKNQPMSKTSSKAWRWILDKIIHSDRANQEFDLIIVNINPKDGGIIPRSITFTNDEDFRSAERNGQTNGTALLKHMFLGTRNFGILFTGCVREGPRHKVICEEVKNLKPHLLVVEGRHPNHKQLKHRLFYTDTSEYCLEHVKCPVLVFPVVVEDEREEDQEDLEAVEPPKPEPTEKE